jgi:16S rRNA (guanine527-N7)-methyltransferase
LPAAYRHALDAGLAAIGIELDAAARDAIDGHVRLLLAWNRAINLTAIREPEQVAVAHVVDSLTAVTLLRDRGVDRFLDLGSGGGFPGLPLAATLPARDALLVESVGKKARFLAATATATGLADRVTVFAGRAEALAADPRYREGWPAVTVRAVATLAELVELAFPLLARDGALVAWKRGDLAAEAAAAERAIRNLGGGTITSLPGPAGILPGHRLVVASKSGTTPDAFPRDPAVRRRSPW